MNCRPDNYVAFIIYKANAWNEIATRAIEKGHRAWGAKNYRRLVRAHPEIFSDSESKADGEEASADTQRSEEEIRVAPDYRE